MLNLTLASPQVNRHRQSGKDASEWLPDINRCWLVAPTLAVRRKCGLTIDRHEADAIARVLPKRGSTKMEMRPRMAASAPAPAASAMDSKAPERWDDDRNGRINCAEAKRHGIASMHRGHPAQARRGRRWCRLRVTSAIRPSGAAARGC